MITDEKVSLSDIQTGKDDLGVYVRIGIDPDFFSKAAILKTAYWFTDYFYLFIGKHRSSGLLEVEFRLKEGDSIDNLKSACGDFLNRLLDQEVRQQVIFETKEVRDTLIKKAFFEVKSPIPEGIISNELHGLDIYEQKCE